MYVKHRMPALIEVSPKVAKAEILRAYKTAGCHAGEAAAALMCNRHTLQRWVRALGIEVELQALEERALAEGWHHGRKGGAGFHRDPASKARRSRATRQQKRASAATGGKEG